uniref:hypothetical protein n=1 Tax=Amycolatopsis sp. CA-096443 TaxID=3239919 RepID=UPI003F49A9DE
MRTNRNLTTLATALLANPHAHHWAYNLHQHTHIPRNTLNTQLHHLTQQGHLTNHWETPHPPNRPPRHYHQPTPTGITWLTQLITNAHPHHQPNPYTGPPPGTTQP